MGNICSYFDFIPNLDDKGYMTASEDGTVGRYGGRRGGVLVTRRRSSGRDPARSAPVIEAARIDATLNLSHEVGNLNC